MVRRELVVNGLHIFILLSDNFSKTLTFIEIFDIYREHDFRKTSLYREPDYRKTELSRSLNYREYDFDNKVIIFSISVYSRKQEHREFLIQEIPIFSGDFPTIFRPGKHNPRNKPILFPASNELSDENRPFNATFSDQVF